MEIDKAKRFHIHTHSETTRSENFPDLYILRIALIDFVQGSRGVNLTARSKTFGLNHSALCIDNTQGF